MPTANLPDDFDPQAYLRLNPDVAAANMDPVQHYLHHGFKEGRAYKGASRSDAASSFVLSAPSNQNIVDLFQGDWSSSLPEYLNVHATPGKSLLFSDPRIVFAEQNLGPFAGMTVCELGPLEGAHTYMLHERSAAEIHAVEANKNAYLKCLCVKELLGLNRAKFLLGDAVAYLEHTQQRYDAIVASGILYHMKDPLRLLTAIVNRTDRLFIWTHFYDEVR